MQNRTSYYISDSYIFQVHLKLKCFSRSAVKVYFAHTTSHSWWFSSYKKAAGGNSRRLLSAYSALYQRFLSISSETALSLSFPCKPRGEFR